MNERMRLCNSVPIVCNEDATRLVWVCVVIEAWLDDDQTHTIRDENKTKTIFRITEIKLDWICVKFQICFILLLLVIYFFYFSDQIFDCQQ